MGNKTLLMFALMFLVVIVGTALDFSPTVLILTPVLMPIVKQAGIDPVYFGVLFIINNAIGLITPPVGIVLNVVSGVARVPMGAVIRGVNPFLIAQLIVLVLLIVFPDLVMVPSVLAAGDGEQKRKRKSKGEETTMKTLKYALAAGVAVTASVGAAGRRAIHRAQYPHLQRR